jgi:hypothetical protein
MPVIGDVLRGIYGSEFVFMGRDNGGWKLVKDVDFPKIIKIRVPNFIIERLQNSGHTY